MKVRKTKVYQRYVQAAVSLGYSKADFAEALQIVVDNEGYMLLGVNLDTDEGWLCAAFVFTDTPQGFDFWAEIEREEYHAKHS